MEAYQREQLEAAAAHHREQMDAFAANQPELVERLVQLEASLVQAKFLRPPPLQLPLQERPAPRRW